MESVTAFKTAFNLRDLAKLLNTSEYRFASLQTCTMYIHVYLLVSNLLFAFRIW